jgi:glycine dehydrogenase
MSHRSDFVDRHIGPNQYQVQTMLLELGFKDLDSFIKSVVPANIHIKGEIEKSLPNGISEVDALSEIKEIASLNKIMRNFIGAGYYGTITPNVILRNVLENPGWYTAYTPYQPEISQGRLEAIFAFQTAVTDLTGLAIANASMLDEATAAAEAMTLARRVWQGSDEAAFAIDANLHPHVKAVIETRAKPLKIKVIESDFKAEINEEIFAALIAYPNSTGEIKNIKPIIEKIQAKNALAIIDCDLLALTLFKSPGECGADIAIGSAQRFGVPVGFGGPHAGFMAVRNGLERSLPGRLVGQSVDSHGNLAFRLALQTREQHIRRDKATSNICTAQVLLAVISAFYAMWHGPSGLKTIATNIQKQAYDFRNSLQESNYSVGNYEIFDTVLVNTKDAKQIYEAALSQGINLRLVDQEHLAVSFDEQSAPADLIDLLNLFNAKSNPVKKIVSNLNRASEFLTHPIFNTYHSETAMLRYIRTLSDRDLALDRSMIPLGSCTMKLNATSEMIPVTWPSFNSIHPFAPINQSAGYTQLIESLSKWLVSVTGYDAVSLQPNAGSQGEFAGLLAIRNYLDSKGEQSRDICLIPSSAHGTNAASAVMAGMKVIVIGL